MGIATLHLLLLLGCIEDVGKDKVEAIIEAAPEATDESAAAPPPSTGKALQIDPAVSKLRALGAKVTSKHPVVFSDFRGSVDVQDGAVAQLSFTVHTASLESDNPRLTKHLKNEDFLWVDEHPEATFVSSKIALGANAPGMTHTLTGTLSVRGQAKQVTFPARIEVSDNKVVANAEFVINRQDFGINYPGRADDLVQDNVVLTIAFQATSG